MIKTQVVKLDYVHAAIIADQMMSNASELRGLHGDLHRENIMFSSRGWLVIDPVGLVGEVGFGAANMFYDPAGQRRPLSRSVTHCTDGGRILSRALDVDPRRLLDQAYAYGCLSAAWNADGEEEQRSSYRGLRSNRCDRRHTRYQATSPIPGNTSILPENIVGQSLSVGFRPLPQTTPLLWWASW